MFQLLRDPKFDFMGMSRLWMGVSLTLMVLSLGIIATKGIRKGIEFEGGVEIQVQYKTPPDVGAVRGILEGAGFQGSLVTSIGKPEEHELYLRVPLVQGAEDEDLAPRVVKALEAAQGKGVFEVRSQSYIGPTVGRELVRKAIGAILGSLGGMLVYIWIRFEFQWGLAAVVALVHDTIITLGAFSLFGYEMSLPVVASFLTLVGYSSNDTVVVFDRIRENLRARGGTVTNLADLINASINQTLSRTILTSLLTWMVCLSLFFVGGPALRDFSFVLVFGIVIGSYSSIYIAAPILVSWQNWRGQGLKKSAAVEPGRPTARKVRAGKA